MPPDQKLERGLIRGADEPAEQLRVGNRLARFRDRPPQQSRDPPERPAHRPPSSPLAETATRRPIHFFSGGHATDVWSWVIFQPSASLRNTSVNRPVSVPFVVTSVNLPR